MSRNPRAFSLFKIQSLDLSGISFKNTAETPRFTQTTFFQEPKIISTKKEQVTGNLIQNSNYFGSNSKSTTQYDSLSKLLRPPDTHRNRKTLKLSQTSSVIGKVMSQTDNNIGSWGKEGYLNNYTDIETTGNRTTYTFPNFRTSKKSGPILSPKKTILTDVKSPKSLFKSERKVNIDLMHTTVSKLRPLVKDRRHERMSNICENNIINLYSEEIEEVINEDMRQRAIEAQYAYQSNKVRRTHKEIMEKYKNPTNKTDQLNIVDDWKKHVYELAFSTRSTLPWKREEELRPNKQRLRKVSIRPDTPPDTNKTIFVKPSLLSPDGKYFQFVVPFEEEEANMIKRKLDEKKLEIKEDLRGYKNKLSEKLKAFDLKNNKLIQQMRESREKAEQEEKKILDEDSANKNFIKAVYEGNVELVKVYIKENKTLLTLKLPLNQSLLHIAVKGGQQKMVKFLLQKRMNAYQEDSLGRNAFRIASAYQQTEIRRYLVKKYRFRQM